VISCELAVRTPYRLDLTVDALRRVPGNLVDIVTSDGRYLRALPTRNGVNVIEVRQLQKDALEVHITGRDGRRQLGTVSSMLGTEVDLRAWYRRTKAIPWIDRLAREFRGLKPPRYPELWEALCHGIVFQQISILAGAAVMRRFVERFSSPVEHGGLQLYPFPRPEAILRASPGELRSVGLSRMKALYLRNAAAAVIASSVTAAQIKRLSTLDASRLLCSLHGIGPWSAAIILLRGFGRLEAFPLGDSGVARGVKALSTERAPKRDEILSSLGDVRGMLYFHLLLARRMTTQGEVTPRPQEAV
jgi:DNA-3-methyladenine glycosylase II